MLDIKLLDILSYGLNIVFVTWGIVGILKDSTKDKHAANYFNAGYEMANRLANELGKNYPVGQVRDIASFLKSATMNFMKKQRNEIGEIGSKNSWSKNKK